MRKIFDFLGGRKFTLVVFAVIVTLINPTVNVQDLLKILGLPSLFVLVEGIRDIVEAAKKKNA